MDNQNAAHHPSLKNFFEVSGIASEGTAGPAIGHVDIGVSDAVYLFRVALPGLRKKQSAVKCMVESDGKVHIELVFYQMQTQQLCAAGPFTISFTLPGPVDTRLFSPVFRPDGILEVVVLRPKISSDVLKYPFDGSKSSPVKFSQVTV